jgi:hypothetical protein
MKGAYLFLKNYGVLISFLLGILYTITSVGILIIFVPAGTTPKEVYPYGDFFDPAIYTSYSLIILGLVVAFLGSFIYTILNLQETYKSLIGIALVLLLGVISWLMGATPTEEQLVFYQGVDNKHLTVKDIAFIDGLLIYTGIMIFLTMCSLVFMGIWGFIKQR